MARVYKMVPIKDLTHKDLSDLSTLKGTGEAGNHGSSNRYAYFERKSY